MTDTPTPEARALVAKIKGKKHYFPLRDRDDAHAIDAHAESVAKARLETAAATLDDEEAAHQDTLRLWSEAETAHRGTLHLLDEAKARLAEAESVIAAAREIVNYVGYVTSKEVPERYPGPGNRLADALAAYDAHPAPELAGDDRRCHETNDAQIKHMANRFLSWPNLLTVPKAEAMVRYMLVGNDRKEVMPHTGRTPKHDKTQAPSPVGGAAPPDFTERAREIRRRAWRRHASELHSTGLLLAEIVEQEIAADLSQLAAETEARVRREVVSMAEKFVIETAMSGPARRVLRQCIRSLAAPQPTAPGEG